MNEATSKRGGGVGGGDSERERGRKEGRKEGRTENRKKRHSRDCSLIYGGFPFNEIVSVTEPVKGP